MYSILDKRMDGQMNFREKLIRFMQGRYGIDQLSNLYW